LIDDSICYFAKITEIVAIGETKMAGDKTCSVNSEAAALISIVKWSEECSLWQRDALRRMCIKEDLDGTDLDDLTAICKGDSTKAVVLDSIHVRDPAAACATVTLKALHSVKNVNALAEGEKLSVVKTGLTVIYGDNGSGKSGYARILKQMCRARSPKNETILPNIYDANSGQPTAAVEFSVNDQNRTSSWALGQPADPFLSAVSVFDCRTANIHVDQKNDVAYTPLPLKILATLAQTCLEVKRRLNNDIKAMEQQTPEIIKNPACQPGTAVGKLIAGLSAKTKPENVAALAVLSETEKTRLTTLKTDLASDPARAVRQLQALKVKVDNAAARLEGLQKAISTDNIAVLVLAFRTFSEARAAAQAASTALFSEEPLPEIGSGVWRALWEAARTYSEKAAYPQIPFPVTGEGARCPLCHQELSTEAAGRLNRFEAFVKDESKRREELAQKAYDQAIENIGSTRLSQADVAGILALIRDDLGDSTLAVDLRKAVIINLWRLRQVLRHHQEHPEPAWPSGAPVPCDTLRTRSSDLQARATALSAEATSDERKKLIAERDELADREWLGGLKDDVIAEIGRKKQIAALQKAAQDTKTNRITSKSAEIAENLVTNAMRAQFAKEIAHLNIASLAIELRQENTAQGVPLFRVCLINKPDAKVSEVLSEGEHRCVALAAFLAELTTAGSHSAIVFDDPVSSLDHMHREAVAKRLAEEGKQRQIVVFTHDIAFLFLLHDECRTKGTPIAFRSICRGGPSIIGLCQQEAPLNAQPVATLIYSLRKHLDNRKIHYERGDKNEWGLSISGFQDQLRKAWERAVEEAMSPVIKRLSNKVDTKGLNKITILTIEDCKTMREGFGRCSELLHSSSEVLNKPLPGPDKVAAEIDALEGWVTSVKQRQDNVQAAV
jgi:energy-coupling factor transporter ATP-binding protein EcfA2